MNRVTRLTSSDTIIVFVQGWIGSVQADLAQGLLHRFSELKFDFWSFDFKGHSVGDPYLSTLSEMVHTLHSEVSLISSLYPEKRIIFVGHSQGCVVLYRYLSKYQLAIPSLFITPAFDIQRIILENRFSKDELTILRTGSVSKEFRKGLFKTVTPQWLDDYESQEYSQPLPVSNYYSIFGMDDPIVEYDTNKKIFETISYNSPSKLIEGDHVFSHNQDGVLHEVEDFLFRID
jgi:pimeloyl-ACP methyl ester carboxylesterase